MRTAMSRRAAPLDASDGTARRLTIRIATSHVATQSATRMRVVGVLAVLGSVIAASLGGCVAGGGGYDSGYEGGAEVGYGVDFYEPYGYDYGGWGRGYRVGPPGRGHDDHGHGDHGHDDHGHPGPGGAGPGRPGSGRPPAYHPAPAGRPMPSIPHAPRGGGGHGPRH